MRTVCPPRTDISSLTIYRSRRGLDLYKQLLQLYEVLELRGTSAFYQVLISLQQQIL